jgi:GT2 family glycosyltransferase
MRKMCEVNALILNWNESHISVDSASLLLNEGVKTIVVDNGSEDGSVDKFKKRLGKDITLIALDKNYGSSVGRNVGIELVNRKYTFLLDGDILYVPGTIAAYQKILEEFEDAACVGYYDYVRRVLDGSAHGTNSREKADQAMSDFDKISNWYPIAWTQYGLFRSEILKKYKFPTVPPFDNYGYGFEDDWLYHQFRADGYESLHVDKPLYYHDAHFSVRELARQGLPNMVKERKAVFEKHWGKENSSSEKFLKVIPISYKKIL